MSLAIGLGGEPVVAELTLVGFLASVGPHVSCQSAFIVTRVCTRAHITTIRGFVQVLFVVPFEGSQVWVHSRAEPARELPLELHVPDQRVSVIMISDGLVDVGGGLGLLQLIDAAVTLAGVVVAAAREETIAIDATGPGDVDDGLDVGKIFLAAATVIFLPHFRSWLLVVIFERQLWWWCP